MRELHYVNDVLLVSDDICEAVFFYAAALARAASADVVKIPTFVNGRRSYSNLVLGPASQLYCTDSEVFTNNVDIDDPALVTQLQALTRSIGIQRAVAPSGDTVWELPTFDDEMVFSHEG